MSRRHRGRKMREFSYLNSRYINKNYLKFFRHAMKDICSHSDITENELTVMLFMYDYEFFTANHMAEELMQSNLKFKQRVLYPLQNRGWIEKVYTRTDLQGEYLEVVFQDEFKSYRHRYSLTHKARNAVQRFYRKVEGAESIRPPA
jgi:hypothetical protein